MAFSRALLLKGLAGAGVIGAIGGGVTIFYRESSKNKREARKEVNGKLETLGLEGDCRLGENEDPYVISKECDLNEEKLKKIRFSNKGEGDLNVVGSVPEGLKLKIGGSNEDISFSFLNLPSPPITLFGDTTRGKIVLKSSESKFKVIEDRLTKENPNEDLKKFNEQLGKVNAPIECRFDESEADTSVECPITQDLLKGMKFSSGEGDLTISGWPASGEENIKLKAEKDKRNVVLLSFTGLSGNLTISQGKDQIVVNGDKRFRVEEDGKKEKVYLVVAPTLKEKLIKFNGQLETIKAPDGCKFNVDWTEEEKAEKSVECDITQDQFKSLVFSNKGDGDLKVLGWPTETVKLKVEREGEVATKMFLSFPGLVTSPSSPVTIYGKWGKIVIKDKEQKFTVVEGKLTKESSNVDETLKKFNKQLGTVNAPVECRFDEEGAEESVECSVSKEQLPKMKFYGGKSWELTEGKDDLNGMRLKVQSHKKVDLNSKEGDKELILTFKDYKKTVELKSEGKTVTISLVKNTNPEFEIDGKDENSVLQNIWEPKKFGNLLSLNCFIPVGDDIKEDVCNFTGAKKINVGKGTDDQFEELTVTDANSKFELKENVEEFNQGFKFVFKGKTVSGSKDVSLENDKSYEFKWKLQNKERIGYLVKKD